MTRWMVSAAAGAGILSVGVLGMAGMLALKDGEADAHAPVSEPVLYVEAVSVERTDVAVTVTGYGEARPRRQSAIAPEVSGAVVEVHEELVPGHVVREGETLFVIDPSRYETGLEEAEAVAAQWGTAVRRLEVEYANDEERLKTLTRTMELAKAQYERTQQMRSQSIGNQSQVDEAEQLYNGAMDAVDQLKRQLNVYPIRIEEAEMSHRASLAKAKMAELNLRRTRVTAPFDGRVTEVNLELGQMAQPGVQAVVLSDDSVIEIPVKIDSRDARDWLQFDGETDRRSLAWFAPPVETVCRVQWTDAPQDHSWEGRIDRIEEFNRESRMVAVTIRVDGEDACGSDVSLPLVAGMFCEVRIPGKTLRDVFAVPQEAIGVDGTIRVVEDGRLISRHVEVARRENGTAYVADGLATGARVVTTRLVGAPDGALVDVVNELDANAEG